MHEVACATSNAPQPVHEGGLSRVLKADEADVALLSQDAPRYFLGIFFIVVIDYHYHWQGNQIPVIFGKKAFVY